MIFICGLNEGTPQTRRRTCTAKFDTLEELMKHLETDHNTALTREKGDRHVAELGIER